MALTVLDAGVVIALGDTADAHHQAAQTAVRRARAAGRSFLLPASALAEVMVGPIKTHGLEEGRRRVERLLHLLLVQVAPLDGEVAVQAAALRARHGRRLRLPDALVIAAAAHHGATVLTTDARWPSVRGVRRITVVGGRARSRPVGVR